MALFARPGSPRPAPGRARALAAVGAVIAASLTVVAATGAPARAATFADRLTVTGKGNGHGDGLSQWGAYGYATTQAWDWHRILAHYYGGTVEAADSGTAQVDVRLTGLDDRPFTAVANAKRNLATSADGLAGRWGTVLAVKIGTGTYKVYGRADAQCPTSVVVGDLDKPASGWTVLAASTSSTTAAGAPASRLEVSVPGVDLATSDRTNLAGVCQPDGSVKAYRGSILIVAGTSGEARTVNKLPADQYLRGVVPRESPASWGSAAGGAGMHALRAQAVAARTYALAENRYSYADTCDTDACQVYGGAAWRAGGPNGTLVVGEDARTDTAVADTAGVVLRKANGALAYTQFNSSSGGWTSGANFPRVEDVGDGVSANPWRRWTRTITRAEIEQDWPAVGTLTAIDVTKRNGVGEWGGRIETLQLTGTKGKATVSGGSFAGRLGLPSAWLDLSGAGAGTGTGGGADGGPSWGCSGPPVTASSAAAAAVQTFHRLAPQRLIDTRAGTNVDAGALAAGCVLAFEPGALANLPAGASAVSLNLTVTEPGSNGYATVYPCDRGVPLASTLNFRTGQTVANQVAIPVDGDGRVCVFALQRTHVVVDLLGWFGPAATAGPTPSGTAATEPGELFAPLTPARVADTRTGQGGTKGALRAGGVVTVPVTAALPDGATPTAVVLNVTATGTQSSGFLTVYACDSERPLASNLNPVAGRDVAAHVVAPVSAAGMVCVYSLQPTDVVVDIMGWYGGEAPAAVGFTPLAPSRLLDTRRTGGAVAGRAASRSLTVTGVGGVPASGVSAVVVNVTATGATGDGFVTVHPCEAELPASSNLNVEAGLDVANMVTVPVGPSGTVCLYANRTTDLVVDVEGWYGTPAPG